MYVPPQIETRIASLGTQLNCALNVTRCWQSEGGRPVLYANFKGLINDTPLFRLEVGGTLCYELTPELDDLLDLFIFLNGKRLTCAENGSKYLIGRGDSLPDWDYDDDGYWNFTEMTEESFFGPVAPSMQIRPPSTDPNNAG